MLECRGLSDPGHHTVPTARRMAQQMLEAGALDQMMEGMSLQNKESYLTLL
uniref:Uncharacterized protein n=1 Tax=Murine herpesvirus TaxID=1431748 RepID=A0A6M4EI90_9BETA